MAKKLENYIEYLKTERQTEMKVISFADLRMLKQSRVILRSIRKQMNYYITYQVHVNKTMSFT